MSEFIMQIRRTAGLWEQFFSRPGILQSLLKITRVLLKQFQLRNLNKSGKSYIEFYIPAYNRLLLTLKSWMSTLCVYHRASHWCYCKTSWSSSQVDWLFSRRQQQFLPTVTNHLFRGFTGDKEVAIWLFLWVPVIPVKFQKFSKFYERLLLHQKADFLAHSSGAFLKTP